MHVTKGHYQNVPVNNSKMPAEGTLFLYSPLTSWNSTDIPKRIGIIVRVCPNACRKYSLHSHYHIVLLGNVDEVYASWTRPLNYEVLVDGARLP